MTLQDPDIADGSLRAAVGKGLTAARANVWAGVTLWMLGLAIVLGYFFVGPMQEALAWVASVKAAYGFGYSVPATVVFVGLVPFGMQVFQPRGRRNFSLSYLLFIITFCAWKGAEVDLLYRIQAAVFGDRADVGTIIAKTIVDQFVYVPLWAVPTMVIPFLWANAGFQGWRVARVLRGRWYRRRMLPVLISNWAVWIPAVSMIYLLPLPLQLPIQNVVACFWMLMLMFMTRDDRT